MSTPVSERDRLADIEARLERIEDTLNKAYELIAPVLANPGKILAKMMGGGR